MFEYSDFEDRLSQVLSYLHPWEKEARYDFGFYSLNQWDEKDQDSLDEADRPHLVFDRTRPIIDAIAGTQVTSRYEAKFMPRDPAPEEKDAMFSEPPSKVYKWAWQRADMEHQISSAFHSALVCGVGCVGTSMNYELDPSGIILAKRIPIFQMGWDPDSVEPNFEDAKYVIRDRWVDEDELKTLFDDDDIKEIINMASSQDGSQVGADGLLGMLTSKDVDDGFKAYVDKKGRKYYQKRLKKIRLWECQRFDRKYESRIFIPPELVAMVPGTPEEEFVPKKETRARMEELNAMVESYNEQARTSGAPPIQGGIRVIEDFPVRTYYRSYHAGRKLLREDEMPHRDFTYKFITCFEDWHEEDRRYYFGFMRSMRDPQKYANKFLSQAIHMFSVNPKGGLMYEEDLFEDEDTAANEYAKASGLIKVRSGSLSQSANPKYVQLTNPVNMRGIETLLQHSIGSVSSSAGINEGYFGGQVGDLRRTAAEAVQSVQEANLKNIAGPFDSLRLFKKRHAILILSFVKNFIQDSVIEKVLNHEELAAAEILRSEDIERQYDVVTEEVPTSPNKEMEIFSKFMETNFFPQLKEMGVGVPGEMAKFFPVPADVKASLQGMFEQANETAQLQMAVERAGLMLQLAQIQQATQMAAQGIPTGGPGEGQENNGPPQQGA